MRLDQWALPEPRSILVGSDSGAPVVVSWWRPA